MKTSTLLIRSAICAVLVLVASCARKKDFVKFLADEIASNGGKTNRLARTGELQGGWTVRRDPYGVAIDTDGIRFDAITNLLTEVYGAPEFYSAANVRHGPTYIYLPTNAGISVFVSGTKKGAEVTLTKPPNKIQ